MGRFATALIALLALVALVTAAGSYETTGQPRLGVDSTTVAPNPPDRSPGVVESSKTDTNQSRNRVGNGEPPKSPPEDPGNDDGLSTLIVVGLLGGLFVVAVLAVVLTDDDTRAPPRTDDDQPDDDRPPTPTVDPAYETPADNAVVSAWRRLTDRVDAIDDASTPGEAASAAVEEGSWTDDPDAKALFADDDSAVHEGVEPEFDYHAERAAAAVARIRRRAESSHSDQPGGVTDD